jgi:hypothetical protein
MRRKVKYSARDCSHCWFRYGFMEYTGERPKITDRDGPWKFKIDGLPVKYVLQNHQSYRITCPLCGKMCRGLHKWPEPDAKWGCKKCCPSSRDFSRTCTIYQLVQDYTIDEIMLLTPKQLSKITGIKDVVPIISRIINNPELFFKTKWNFRPIDRLQWRTDDMRIPLAAKMASELKKRSGRRKRERAWWIKARVTLPVLKALHQYAKDNGMNMHRTCGALLRWAMAHSDEIQIRPI